jgi:hypothetical protein
VLPDPPVLFSAPYHIHPHIYSTYKSTYTTHNIHTPHKHSIHHIHPIPPTAHYTHRTHHILSTYTPHIPHSIRKCTYVKLFFFRFPNLFAICMHTFKYYQQIVCWKERAGRGVLCSTHPWKKGENLVWLSEKKGTN